jgi:hypothetical protein
MANSNTLLETIQQAASSTGLIAPVPTSATAMTIEMLQLLSATSGIISDPNVGSNLRSLATTIGAIIEQQNITSRVITAQNILNLLLTAYSVSIPQATFATGNVVFTLASSLSTVAVVPQGTQVGTSGGLIYATTTALSIPAGNLSGTVSVQATQSGNIYNVSAGSITNILSSLPQTFTVSNTAPISGGTNAPSVTTILNLIANAILGQATATPQSIASVVFGLALTTGETVEYSTVYEPWLYASGSGQVAGYTVYIDNGSGAASADLVTYVNNFLLNSSTTNIPSAIPAGVPFSVAAVVPVDVSVTVTATTYPQYSSSISFVSTLITNAADSYFQTLNFGDTFNVSDLLVVIDNNTSGLIQGLSVTATPSDTVTALPYQRIILEQLTLNITPG